MKKHSQKALNAVVDFVLNKNAGEKHIISLNSAYKMKFLENTGKTAYIFQNVLFRRYDQYFPFSVLENMVFSVFLMKKISYYSEFIKMKI